MRQFKGLFKFVVKQGGKRRLPNPTRMCYWDKDRSWKKLIFSSFVSEKWQFDVRLFRGRMCLVKNGSNMYFGDYEAKEFVIICDHIHFSCKHE